MQDKIGKSIGVKTNARIPLSKELIKAKKPKAMKDKAMKSTLIFLLENNRTNAIETTVPIVNNHVMIVNLPIEENVGIEKNDKPKRIPETVFKIATNIDGESVYFLRKSNIDFNICSIPFHFFSFD